MSPEKRKTIRHMLKQYSEALLGGEKQAKVPKKEPSAPRIHRRGGRLNNKPPTLSLSLNDLLSTERVENPNIVSAKAGTKQGKNDYSHFSMLEDYSFIQCIIDFHTNPAGYTRQVYFERLAERFQRTLCSVRRRWERIHSLSNSQKRLIISYYTAYPDVAPNRRVVFSKDTKDAGLLTCDNNFVPWAERTAFNALRKDIFGVITEEILQQDPHNIFETSNAEKLQQEDEEGNAADSAQHPETSLKIDGGNQQDIIFDHHNSGTHANNHNNTHNRTQTQEVVNELVVQKEAVKLADDKEQKEDSAENESASSNNSIFLNLSGNEEETNRLCKNRNGRMRKMHTRDTWNFQKHCSENNSRLSDLMSVSANGEVYSPRLAKRTRRDHSPDLPTVVSSRKRQKVESSVSPNDGLKNKVELFKVVLTDDTSFVQEKTELLKSLVSYFANNYDCTTETVEALIRREATLNMEDLKFRLCMKFLSNRLNNVRD